MGANCSNCAGNCQKGDKNEVNAEFSNHLLSDEHLKRVLKSQPHSQKSQDSQLDKSQLQSKQHEKFNEWAQIQNEDLVKPKMDQTSMLIKITQSPSPSSLQFQQKETLSIQRYWRGYQARQQIHNMKSNNQKSNKSSSGSFKGAGVKEANYFKQKDNEMIASEMTSGVDKRERISTYTFKSGATFEGEWLNHKRDGYGVQIWPDGAKYEGIVSLHQQKAIGSQIEHVDKAFFIMWMVISTQVSDDNYKYIQGEWKDDRANGFGCYKQISGACYEGMWKNDYQHGKGKELWMDKSWYEGEYMDGKKNGQGKYVWPDTSYYDGMWQENKINGYGEYSWIDGRSFKGHWKNNNMHGHGVYKWKDGRIYDGEYLNDKKHVNYIRYYEGEWVDGKQHGKGRYVLENGSARLGLWEHGKRLKWIDDLTKCNV